MLHLSTHAHPSCNRCGTIRFLLCKTSKNSGSEDGKINLDYLNDLHVQSFEKSHKAKLEMKLEVTKIGSMLKAKSSIMQRLLMVQISDSVKIYSEKDFVVIATSVELFMFKESKNMLGLVCFRVYNAVLNRSVQKYIQ